jgi:hypothetical protein
VHVLAAGAACVGAAVDKNITSMMSSGAVNRRIAETRWETECEKGFCNMKASLLSYLLLSIQSIRNNRGIVPMTIMKSLSDKSEIVKGIGRHGKRYVRQIELGRLFLREKSSQFYLFLAVDLIYVVQLLHRQACTSLCMWHVYHAQCRSRDPATAVRLDLRFQYQLDGDL